MTQTWPAAIFATRGTDATVALPPSLQWPAKKSETAVPPDLEICEGNWKMAEDEPETVQSLLRNEIAEARELPLGIAVGKLNVVFAEGKEPRLVLDSTVCQVNTRCHLPERLSLPMASDVALSTQPEDTPGAFVGASIDFKAAHKQVQVALKSMAFCCSPFRGNSTIIEFATLEAVSRHSGGSALEHFYFAKCTGYWLGSLTKPSFS